MENTNKLLKFVSYGNFSEDNINYLKEETGKNNTQLIRDSFELLKSCVKLYDNTEYDAQIIHNITKYIIVICEKQKFSEEEIEINRKRIKRARNSLYNVEDRNNILLDSINLLDEIPLEKI